MIQKIASVVQSNFSTAIEEHDEKNSKPRKLLELVMQLKQKTRSKTFVFFAAICLVTNGIFAQDSPFEDVVNGGTFWPTAVLGATINGVELASEDWVGIIDENGRTPAGEDGEVAVAAAQWEPNLSLSAVVSVRPPVPGAEPSAGAKEGNVPKFVIYDASSDQFLPATAIIPEGFGPSVFTIGVLTIVQELEATADVGNNPPTAADDAAETDEDTSVTTGDVLVNDSDPDGDTLSVESIDTTGTVGSVTDNGDGTFTYDPNGQFEDLNDGDQATDSFAYTVSDGNEGTDTATVTITINGVTDPVENNPPTAEDDTAETDEDTAVTTGDVLANDSDPDGDTLSVESIDTTGTVGSVTDNGDGTFTYDPNGQFEDLNDGDQATDSFVYTVSDGNEGTDTATVTITINGVTDQVENNPPTAADDSAETDEDTPVTTGDVLVNDSDPDGDTLSVESIDTTGTVGSVTDNGDGTFTYDPNGQFEDLNDGDQATDSFAYTVSDGKEGTDTATVTITINGLDEPPEPFMLNISSDPVYDVLPLLTVGDEVPMLVGNFGEFTLSDQQTFAMAGIPDGLGFKAGTETNFGNVFYVWINHELHSTETSKISSTVSGQIRGARVSLYVFSTDWDVIGGRNLIEEVEADGSVFKLNTESGDYVNTDGVVLNEAFGENDVNLSHLSSGYLASTGFVDDEGDAIPVWFAPEEVNPRGRGYAVFPNGTALALDGLGLYSKEQVYTPLQYRASNSNVTVILSTEETTDGEIYMYVGEQTADDPNGFLNGQLYTLRVEDEAGTVFADESMPEDTVLRGVWVTVDQDRIDVTDARALSNWVNGADEGILRSTNFAKSEDIHEDPNKPGTFYFVTTGVSGSPNEFGMMFRFRLNETDPTGDMEFELVLVGGPDTGVSYDNIVVDSNGFVLIQEHRTAGGREMLTEQMRQGRVLAYDIDTEEVTFLFEANQAAIDPSVAMDYGNWEPSGIVEVDAGLSITAGSSYLLDVQAHSIPDSDYVQGGQLLLMVPKIDDNLFQLTVLHNNDGESQLINAGSGLEDFGGAARFKALIEQLKEDAAVQGSAVITLSSGDNFLAGPEFRASLDLETFFDAKVLDSIEYDAIQLGNHDFDFGPDLLADFIKSFENPVTYLAGNLDFSGEADLQVLVDAGTIAPSVVVEKAGERIGVVGAVTPNLPFISSPGSVTLIDADSDQDSDIEDIRIIVQEQIDALQGNGVNKIILISHLQGIEEDMALVPLLSGVDIVIAGGGDELLANPGDRLLPEDETSVDGPYPIRVNNADGVVVPVVTTAGGYRYIGRLNVLFDSEGNVAAFSGGPMRVSGIEPDGIDTDENVQTQYVNPIVEFINDLDQTIVGTSEVPLNGTRGGVRGGETNLGDLIADALLWQANTLAADFGLPQADIAIQNSGGIRNNTVIPTGNITELDTFDILPFSNFVSIVPDISPVQLKEILENAVSALGRGSGTGRFAQIAGMHIVYDPEATPQELDGDGNVVIEGNRVISIVLDSGEELVRRGTVVDEAPNINIATIDFVARGGDRYPFRGASFTSLRVTYQQALSNFVQNEGALNGLISEDSYPEGGIGRLISLPTTPETDRSVATPIVGSIGDLEGAEISAFDPRTEQLFVTGTAGADNAFKITEGAPIIQVVDVSNPELPSVVTQIDLSGIGSAVQSVSIWENILAVAVAGNADDSPGFVAFFDIDDLVASPVAVVEVGVLPDMLTFNETGTRVLVANEGEPVFGDSGNLISDPEGSVSIIDLPEDIAELTQDGVRTADFRPFNDRENELRNRGVRIFPGRTASQDLEPEYIACSLDGLKAYVTLQENNAVGVVDIETAEVLDVIGLGLKDHSKGPAKVTNFPFAELPVLGVTAAENPADSSQTVDGQTIRLGGLSGLWFEGVDDTTGNLKFVTVPDRGPNGEPTNVDEDESSERPFALPDYQARVVRFELNRGTGHVQITEQIFLTRGDGVTPVTGLPNIPGVDEEPVDLFGNALPYDTRGADMEGIVIAPDGSYWMVDEYRPAVYHFTSEGVMIDRFVPEGTAALAGEPEGTFGSETLPAEYANRRRNRGFEAAALDAENGILYAFIQTPLANPDRAASDASNVIRILGVATSTGEPVSEYVYLLEGLANGARENKVDKIGDATYAGNGRFFVIERDSGTDVVSKKYIYEIDLLGATNLLDADVLNLPENETLEQQSADDLNALGITPVYKRKVLNLPSIGYLAGDKPEGLALLPDGALAVLNDNDFGLLDVEIPIDGTIVPNPNPTPVTLGIIDFGDGNTVDLSDRDNGINLQNHPVFGMYIPDSIVSYEGNDGRLYLVTANEGDDRGDFDENELGDAVRIKNLQDAELSLNPDRFSEDLDDDEVIGRWKISRIDGDLDGDGSIDIVHGYGGRSFAIWDEFGNLVFDSSDDIGKITAAEAPRLFNAEDSNPDEFDNRSDNKGAEPEGVAIAETNGRMLAFIGLEHGPGGVLIYDITDPFWPAFVQYARNADDVSPEGLVFVNADDSPTAKDLLVVSNEDSNSITLFEIQDEGATLTIEAASVGTPQGLGTRNVTVSDLIEVDEGRSQEFSVSASNGVPPYTFTWTINEEVFQEVVDMTGDGESVFTFSPNFQFVQHPEKSEDLVVVCEVSNAEGIATAVATWELVRVRDVDQRPIIPTLSISPNKPKTLDDIKAVIEAEVIDPDGDLVTSLTTLWGNNIISGSQEVPAVDTPAQGFGLFIIDTAANTLDFEIFFEGLIGNETAAHIHGPAEVGEETGVLFDLPSGNPKTGTWDYDESQESTILSGQTYVNIHSDVFPEGEIRGQLLPVQADEASVAQIGGGFLPANFDSNSKFDAGVIVADVLPNVNTEKGDIWTVSVSAKTDPYEEGEVVLGQFATAQVEILNSPPSISGAEIVVGSEPPTSGNELGAFPLGTQDDDGDEVQFQYQWTRNGNIIPDTNRPILRNDDEIIFTGNDEITVIITPTDGGDLGEPVESDPLLITFDPTLIWQTAPDSVDFGTVPIDELNGLECSRTVQITNISTDIHKISAVSIDNASFEFALRGGLGQSIPPDASNFITVFFVPDEVGTVEGELFIETSGGDVIVPLVGSGVDFSNVITVASTSVDSLEAGDLVEVPVLLNSSTDLSFLNWKLEINVNFEFVEFTADTSRTLGDVTASTSAGTRSVTVTISEFISSAVLAGSGDIGTLALRAAENIKRGVFPLLVNSTTLSAQDLSINPVDIAAKNGEIVVGSCVPCLIKLDVDNDRLVNFRDIAFTFRRLFGHPALPPGAVLPDDVTEDDVNTRIDLLLALYCDGLAPLDVDMDGTVNFRDIVFTFRRLFGHPPLTGGTELPADVSAEQVSARIDCIIQL